MYQERLSWAGRRKSRMKAAGWGRIVNFVSAAGISGMAGYGAYNASKEAIRALTRTAAREWGRDGIIVNGVLLEGAKVGDRLERPELDRVLGPNPKPVVLPVAPGVTTSVPKTVPVVLRVAIVAATVPS